MACFGFDEISVAQKALESFGLFYGVKSSLGVQERELIFLCAHAKPLALFCLAFGSSYLTGIILLYGEEKHTPPKSKPARVQ